MQTRFEDGLLEDPKLASSEAIFRTCVHCGLCTSTCPTYVLLGDELDSPRGRIYLMKDMMEKGRPATAEDVKHIDRCLSCLSCTTTCPSGVDYMHLINHGREYIEDTYQRPLLDRAFRQFLATVLPRPKLFRALLRLAPLGRAFAFALPARLRPALNMAPKSIPSSRANPAIGRHASSKTKTHRVAIFLGCAQQVLEPEINAATVRLLTRLGVEVEILNSACCGALVHHLGKTKSSHALAEQLIKAAQAAAPFDAFIMNASGCGTTIKDYGHMFPEWPAAVELAGKTLDLTEFLEETGLLGAIPHARPEDAPTDVTYHSACSMQHGQKIKSAPQNLLSTLGLRVHNPIEGHLCCGSAGSYNLLQPEIATQLAERKTKNLDRTKGQLIIAGNIGCLKQLENRVNVPMVHTVQLLDWMTGGPKPHQLENQS